MIILYTIQQKMSYTLLDVVYHDISYINLVLLSLYISSIFSIGVSVSFLIVGYYMKGSFFIVKDRYVDRIDKEEEENEKYYKEFNQSRYTNNTLNDLYNLRFKTVRDQSPDGDDIIMTYNSDSGTFWYYCDNKENVKFNTLDAVARKFAIDNNCKCVCINYKEELDKAFHMVDFSVVLKQLKKNDWIKKNKNDGGAIEKNVYATFKKYDNTDNNGNENTRVRMKKHITNRFSYKGKLNEYKPFEEKKTAAYGNDPISFADFKKIQKEKEKEEQAK